MEENNCRFEKVKILSHNIGYLKFNEFPDASICRTTVAAAMASLNHADAIIFDLRDNPGGYANMVALIATYLFDHLRAWKIDHKVRPSWCEAYLLTCPYPWQSMRNLFRWTWQAPAVRRLWDALALENGEL